MKKFIFTLIIFVFFLTNLSAQWEILNEGFRGSVNTIDFVNENVGWIAGGNGTLLKTTDGGENWINIPINENWHITQIDFINESIGWAIGLAYIDPNWTNFIWKTSNGGNTWIQQFFSTVFGFNSLYVIDATNVFTVSGNQIYKTSNGGTDWIDVFPNLQGRNYNSLWFQDSQTGVVVGNYNDGTADRGIILKTTNGGTTWSETILNEFNSIYDLQFLDNTNGYFRANLDTTNYICKTEDMFSSWTVKTQHPYSITSYQFLGNNTAYAIMADSITANNIMKSIDGGITWHNIQSFDIEYLSLSKIFINNLGTGFIIGNYDWGLGLIIKSNTEGLEWSLKKFSYPINDVYFIDKEKGFLIGGLCYSPLKFSTGAMHCSPEGHIFSTDDGGKIWNIVHGLNVIFQSCLFTDEFTGFSVTGGDRSLSSIYKTTDSGNNWAQVNEWPGNDICFMDEENGFVVGRYGDSLSYGAGILKTTDTGETWDLEWQFPDINNYEYNLKSIHFTNSTGWAVGEGGMIVKYSSQTGWVKQTSITDFPLNKVFFSVENNGWISGGYQNNNGFQSVLLRTTNGGEIWTQIPNIPYLINDLAFIDNNLGWAIGYDSSGVGGILKTTDGGSTWEINVGNLPAKLNALHIKDNYGWAVGENGLILRTTNAGPTWVDDENKTLPTEFALEQNYPNPFSAKGGSASGGNPSTKIRYTIPTPPSSSPLVKGRNESLSRTSFGMGFVSLKVYDVLGREIATLVDEYKQVGKYETEFNAANIPSGVYFYRIQVYPANSGAGNFIVTKKMLLLK